MSARAVRSAGVAAAAARLSYYLLRARPPGGAKTWDRTNHRGEPITLLEGPAVVIGSVAGALAAGGGTRERIAQVVAGAGAAALGGYDDLAGNAASRGFRGHIGALSKGELTTGTVKLAGIGVTGLAAALMAGSRAEADRPGDVGTSAPLALADRVINAGLVAGGANLLNLFDLRPGRAIKVATLAGGLLALSRDGRAATSAPLAAAVALLPEDLGERSMLGDAGANGLGAMLGAAAATTLPRRTRVGVLAVIVGLTAASEVVSFTRVIEGTGPLRWLDMLGRRPVAPAAEKPAAPEPAGPATSSAATSSAASRSTVSPAGGTPTSRDRRSAEAR